MNFRTFLEAKAPPLQVGDRVVRVGFPKQTGIIILVEPSQDNNGRKTIGYRVRLDSDVKDYKRLMAEDPTQIDVPFSALRDAKRDVERGMLLIHGEVKKIK